MKASIYNTYLPLSDGLSLLYNAMSDKYIALRTPFALSDLDNPDKITDTDFRNQLEEIGALVSDDTDEVQVLRDMIITNDHADKVFHLHVNPTVDCNFRCWYCYEDHRKGSKMDEQTLNSIIKLMERTVAEHPNLEFFALSFFGGEPLMGFDNVVKPLILALERICGDAGIKYSVHFTSNAALINERMLEFFAAHPASFQITLDGHRAHHDKVRFFPATGVGSYDKVLRNIRELAARQCKVLVRINYTRDNLQSVSDIIEDFRNTPDNLKKYISFDLQRVWQDREKKDEDDVTEIVNTNLKSLREASFGTSIHMAHDLVRNSCYGDKRNYCLVNYDGGVFLCTARDFDDAHCAGKLQPDGTIEWRNDAHECRLASKFSKPVCHKCRIAPICGGGCCTQALEHPEPDICIYRYTEEQKDKMVADRFEQLYMV